MRKSWLRDVEVRHQGELPDGRGDERFIAQVAEQVGFVHRLVLQQHVEGEVATLHLLSHPRPFAEHNRVLVFVGRAECQGIAPDDVALKQISPSWNSSKTTASGCSPTIPMTEEAQPYVA